MSEDQAPSLRHSKAAKPVREVTQFIFIGDPNDNGKGSRAPRDDDDNSGPMCEMYGFKFPLGRAVAVPLDARIGTSTMQVCDKLRGNSHFFEGTESELAAAKASGDITVKPARKKTPVLIRFQGMRRKDLPSEDARAMDD